MLPIPADDGWNRRQVRRACSTRVDRRGTSSAELTRRTKARMLKHSRPNVTNILAIFLGFVLVVPPINRQLMAIISHRFWTVSKNWMVTYFVCYH